MWKGRIHASRLLSFRCTRKIFVMPLKAIFFKKKSSTGCDNGSVDNFFPQVVSSSFRLFIVQQKQLRSTRIPVSTDSSYYPFSIICLSNKCPRVYLEFIFYSVSVLAVAIKCWDTKDFGFFSFVFLNCCSSVFTFGVKRAEKV